MTSTSGRSDRAWDCPGPVVAAAPRPAGGGVDPAAVPGRPEDRRERRWVVDPVLGRWVCASGRCAPSEVQTPPVAGFGWLSCRRGVLAIGLLVVAGCGADAGETQVLEASDGSLVLVAGETTAFGQAAIPGRLIVLQAGCIGLSIGGEDALVVWPAGTVPLADGVGVTVPGFGDLRVGDELDAGGAYTSGDGAVLPEPTDACVTRQIAVVAPPAEPLQ